MWMMTYTNNTSGDLFAQYGMKNYILARRDALKENGDDFEIFYCGPTNKHTFKLFWWCLTMKRKYLPKFFELKA